MFKGKLYVVSLSLGNLQDITPRALTTLQQVAAIMAEDTRQILKLQQLMSLQFAPLYSYRDQTHDRVVSKVLERLSNGDNIALVSDRGTPTISDPGYKLVRDAKQAGFEVVSVPGASAVIAALSISGLPTDRFTFLGFLPRTPGKQRKLLQQFKELETTLIMYESPFRVIKLVESIQQVFGPNVQVSLAKELTKQYEQVIKGSVTEISAWLIANPPQGEWVVMMRE